LIKEHSKDSLARDSLGNEILFQFLESAEKHTKLVALKSMGKSDLYFPNKEIKDIATDSSGGIQAMAQWVLSNSGRRDELEALVDFLFSSDTVKVHYASYALTFKENIPSALYGEMEKCYNAMGKNHPYRVYLVSAMYGNAPRELQGKYKGELLPYSDGKDYESYEVFQALARKASEEDMEFILKSFDDPDLNVRVSVADAYLSNEHYLQSKICWFDWAILLIYGLMLIVIGWYYSYRQKNKEDYYLGGRSVHPFFTGISLYVSYFSAIT
jgi:SSS family solute:Na+ symporter